MGFAKDRHSTNAAGGTELMKHGLESRIDKSLLDEFQIFLSRVEEPLDESKIRILWVHDVDQDPSSSHLANGGWKNFHKIVAVSNWQMNNFIDRFGIPWDKFIVLNNAIVPIPNHSKSVSGPIKLGYWSTPHRGLSLLVPVFKELCKKYNNIELEVFSSFNIYGWPDRDKEFESLFDECRSHPKINYHGSVPNEQLRKELEKIDIFAYPSIWPETSCIALMEAMSARMICVHPNYGALPETAAKWTHQYQWSEDPNKHAQIFYGVLSNIIDDIEHVKHLTQAQKTCADMFYNWDVRAEQWKALLTSLLNEPRELPKQMYTFRT